jgi:hypothetical protein
MRTCLYAASIVAAGLVRPAIASSVFADNAYDVKLQYAGETSAQSVCITFDAGGRLSIGGRRTPLVWAARPEFPDQFLAVTAPLESTGVHNAVGVHGGVDHNNSLLASGIDQFGARFALFGELRGGCDGDRTGNRSEQPADAPSALVDLTGEGSGQVAPCASVFCTPPTNPLRANTTSNLKLEPVDVTAEFGGQAAPCDSSFCDPRPDPNSGTTNRAIPSIAGQSFALTLGNGKDVIEYCWSFGSNGQIETAHGTSMTWTSNARTVGDTGFESVGIGHNGQGMAYHGSMEGNVLKVIGIEAQDGKSSVTEGYGQPVARCDAQW